MISPDGFWMNGVLVTSLHKVLVKAGYNTSQPRVAAGSPDGGQWTSDGVGSDVQVEATYTHAAHSTELHKVAKIPPYKTVELSYPTYKAYPTKPEAGKTSIWELIGGKVNHNADNSKSFRNSCAVRISYALNRSGINIPYKKGATVSGKDGKWYLFRVDDMADYLTTAYEKPRKLKSDTWKYHVYGKKGIVLFRDLGYNDARGHLELYNGTEVLNNVGRTRDEEDRDYTGRAAQVLFWPLK